MADDRTPPVVFDTPGGAIAIDAAPGVHPVAPSTVELARRLDVRPGERVLELGCGAGLLAVTAARLGGRVVASDVDARACEATAANALRNGVAVEVRRGDHLEPVAGERFDLVLVNPPQTPFPRPFGPKWGGPDGALHLAALLPALPGHLRPGGRVLALVLSLVDPAALEPLLRPFDVRELGTTERSFAACEYEGYAEGLVAYLENRAACGAAKLERTSDGALRFWNRFLRLGVRPVGPRLVVVADDLGLDAARNEAIVEAFVHGIVRGASLVVQGAAVEDALSRVRAIPARLGPLALGLHANLSEGRPLGPPIEGVTGPDGAFAGRKDEAWRRLRVPDADRAAIARELAWQLDRLAELAVEPAHLDGHHHVHAYPAVRDAAVRLARERRLFLRVPDEADLGLAVDPACAHEAAAIVAEGAALRALVAEGGAFAARAFRGVAARIARGSPLERLRASLERLPESGVVELMVHPTLGAPPEVSELTALVDPSWPDWLAGRGIALSSFAELR